MHTERAVVPEIRAALTAACPATRDGAASDAVGGIGGVGGVGGVTPAFVALPSSTAEASGLLAAAAAHDLTVVPRGAGFGLGWGTPPSSCDLVVDLRRMDQVVEHAAGDLVARVQAGATIGHLASVLAKAGQQLALDAPPDATVGGVVATGTAGPRRFRYGAPRDLLIGITVVRADGVVARSGGKVVKNVAGYDIGKLFSGSRGTLGLITEATFRLHPLPVAVAYVTAEFGSSDRSGAAAAVAAAAGSTLVPSAVELDWPGGSSRPLRVGVLLEGTAAGVAERAKRMSERLGAAGGSPIVAVSPGAPPRWGQLPSSSTVVRTTFWVSKLPGVLDALVDAGEDAGVKPAVSGPAGAGALYACLGPHTEDEAAVRFVQGLRDRLVAGPLGTAGPQDSAGPRGSVTVLAAPVAVLTAAGAYGPVPGAALMRAVKDQFDPGYRMFPGRLAGGS